MMTSGIGKVLLLLGTLAFTADRFSLEPISTYGIPSFRDGVGVADDRIYTVSSTGLIVVEVVDDAVLATTTFPLPGRPVFLSIEGTRALISVSQQEKYLETLIYDLSDPQNPILQGRLGPQKLRSLHPIQHGNYVLTFRPGEGKRASGYKGVRKLFDISNPVQPRMLWTVDHDLAYKEGLIHGQTFYLAERSSLKIFSLADETRPIFVNSLPMESPENLYHSGTHLYLTANGLNIFDVAQPRNPIVASRTEITGSDTTDLYLDGNTLYILTYREIIAYDVSDKTNPVVIRTGAAKGGRMAVTSRYLVIRKGNDLHVYRKSDLTLIGSLKGETPVYGITVRDQYAYLATRTSTRIVSLEQPEAPRFASYANPGSVNTVIPSGRNVFSLGNNGTIYRIDISDPFNAALVSDLSHRPVEDMARYQDVIYATRDSRIQVLDIDGNTLSGHYYRFSDEYLEFEGVDRIHVDAAGERLLVGTGSWLLVLDIRDPLEPRLLYRTSLPGTGRAIGVSGDVAWVACGRYGLVAYDLLDPWKPISSINTKGVAWDLVISGDLVFVAESYAGFSVFDIHNPRSPTLLRQVPLPDFTYTLTVDDDRLLVGGEIGMSIYRFETSSSFSVVPWMVNNQDFSSRLAIFNESLEKADVVLKAWPRDGDPEEKVIEIAGNGIWSASAADLFGDLTGYSLFLTSTAPVTIIVSDLSTG